MLTPEDEMEPETLNTVRRAVCLAPLRETLVGGSFLARPYRLNRNWIADHASMLLSEDFLVELKAFVTALEIITWPSCFCPIYGLETKMYLT
ncbi:hypothetical protein KQX54_004465 [Cotesia glomerata]|uniref:Uncharacterized protein n=1 Tax=Cotesia glomerata TaxID=32391 RepID=A0AAV7ISM8_COTGL|nr:hypothetical protein KQX54_004465 [Cotesia glomerata]